MSNRRFDRPPSWVGYVGDMRVVTEYLLTKPWQSSWGVVKTVNAILRANGTVAFANNPLSGALILIAMFIGNPNVGFACLVSGLIGIIFSKVLKQPEILISDGVTLFNGILVGCIAVAAFPSISGHALDGVFWSYLCMAVLVSAYVDKGLNALMAPSSLPAFSIPFNLSAAFMLLTMRSAAGLEGRMISVESFFPEETIVNETLAHNGTDRISWPRVMEGTLLAAGQIYGVGTVDSSILIYLAFLLYSPLLTIFLYIGSIIGTIIGALVCTAPYMEVYAGLWGYNAMLTSGAISYFLVPTPGVIVAAVVGSTITAVIQAATLHIFSPTTTPVLSYPFNVATVLICAISTAPDSPFTWVKFRSFPEWHLYKHYKNRREEMALGDKHPENGIPLNKKDSFVYVPENALNGDKS
ncbi:urea transporter 1-like isoform X1 [Macrobrachium rosenbergii]|uniref:urea transporter 1-like isoform X1 n=2 Tax=Macrobrachium rosenbergii TaxID=79674 RepID=UPI0034D41425